MRKNRKGSFISLSVLLLLFICRPSYSDEAGGSGKLREVSLDAVLKTGLFGIPEGLTDPGREAYVDFDTEAITYREYGKTPPEEWDMVFTYVVKSVSMGPMGTHPVPYFTLKTNRRDGAVFYLNETEYNLIVTADFQALTLDRYEFDATKKLEYNAPAETFILKTSGNRAIKLLFTSLEGIKENNRLFSAVFLYSEIPVVNQE